MNLKHTNIPWVWPPPSNSDHQDSYIFVSGIPINQELYLPLASCQGVIPEVYPFLKVMNPPSLLSSSPSHCLPELLAFCVFAALVAAKGRTCVAGAGAATKFSDMTTSLPENATSKNKNSCKSVKKYHPNCHIIHPFAQPNVTNQGKRPQENAFFTVMFDPSHIHPHQPISLALQDSNPSSPVIDVKDEASTISP